MPNHSSSYALVLAFISLIPAMHLPAAAQEASDRGTGVMLRKALNITSSLELSGAALCIQDATQAQQDVATYFANNGMVYNAVVFEHSEDIFDAYGWNRCDAVAAEASELEAARLSIINPDEHVLLPERLSSE